MLLIGLDAASKWTNFGYAIGQCESGIIEVEEAGLVQSPTESDALANRIAPRLRDLEHALVAVDAPLGWPRALALALKEHCAGEPIEVGKDALFRRATDRAVARLTGRFPLEVGADRIARTAYSALQMLGMLRQMTNKPIPLAWSPDFTGVAAIEVYPAGTLRARQLPHSKYKDVDASLVRQEIAQRLAKEVQALERYVAGRADVFDACLCLVAAKDFIEGRALPPQDLELAQREGWIWVRAG